MVTIEYYAANVKLMDDLNYSAYKAGNRYTCYGARAISSPYRTSPPYSGYWNVVIDDPGGPLKASIRFLKA